MQAKPLRVRAAIGLGIRDPIERFDPIDVASDSTFAATSGGTFSLSLLPGAAASHGIFSGQQTRREGK